MDISARTVTNSVPFQVLDTDVNKDVSVVNPGVTFLLDAILNKTASYFVKTETSSNSTVCFLHFFTDKRKLIIELTNHNAFKLEWAF